MIQSQVFLTKFEVFGNWMKHCLKCFIDVRNQNISGIGIITCSFIIACNFACTVDQDFSHKGIQEYQSLINKFMGVLAPKTPTIQILAKSLLLTMCCGLLEN